MNQLKMFTPHYLNRNAFIHSKYVFNPKGYDLYALPRITLSVDARGYWHITVEVSLPKLLFTTNVRMITEDEVRQALDLISHFISSLLPIDFDAHTAFMSRIDYCWNFQVGEANVRRYLEVIARASMPRMRRRAYGSSTYFEPMRKRSNGRKRRMGRQLLFYDKHEQVCHEVARPSDVEATLGQMRFESRFLTPEACKRLAQKLGLGENVAANLLTDAVAREVLTSDIRSLGLDVPIQPASVRADIVHKAVGVRARPRMELFLTLLEKYGDDSERMLEGGFSKASYHRYIRTLREIDALRTTSAPTPLAPLEVSSTVESVTTLSSGVPVSQKRETYVDSSYSATGERKAGP